MPSTYAHYKFGTEISSKLPEKKRQIILKNEDLFNIGLHGPDLLFYYRPLIVNSVNSLGYDQHSKPGLVFFKNAAKKIVSNHFSSDYLAYVYGVICHFSLDRECHGYIGEKVSQSGVSHSEIEVEFDRMLMLQDGYNPIRHVLTGHISPNKTSAKVISEFYGGVSPDCVYRAMKSFVFYNRLILAPGKIKRNMLYGLLKISGHYDDMHGMIVNYKENPKCEDSNMELLKRFESAKEKALMLIEEFEDNTKETKPWSDLYKYTFGSEYKEDCCQLPITKG